MKNTDCVCESFILSPGTADADDPFVVHTHLLDDVAQRSPSAGAGGIPAQHHVRFANLRRVHVGGLPWDGGAAWMGSERW